MPGAGHDWIMRPVLRGLCRMSDYRGSDAFLLNDIALMNEAIDVQDENAWRLQPKQP